MLNQLFQHSFPSGIYIWKLWIRLFSSLINWMNWWIGEIFFDHPFEALCSGTISFSRFSTQLLTFAPPPVLLSYHFLLCFFVPCESPCHLWSSLSPPPLWGYYRQYSSLYLPHVLPLEDMHPGSCSTLLCVLINILAASGRKWVFLFANLLWNGCLEQWEV